MLRQGAQVARWHDVNVVAVAGLDTRTCPAPEFGKKRETLGFDLSRIKIEHAVPARPGGGHCIGVDQDT
jgi:hypothetical protein